MTPRFASILFAIPFALLSMIRHQHANPTETPGATPTAAAIAGVLSSSASGPAPTPTPTPNPSDLPQVTAEAPPRVPATASCTEQVLTHTFANSYYAPGFGQHLAAACSGPWSAVILS